MAYATRPRTKPSPHLTTQSTILNSLIVLASQQSRSQLGPIACLTKRQRRLFDEWSAAASPKHILNHFPGKPREHVTWFGNAATNGGRAMGTYGVGLNNQRRFKRGAAQSQGAPLKHQSVAT